jgi:hypothetical protein
MSGIEQQRLELLKRFVCGAETLEEFLQRLDLVRVEEAAKEDDDIPTCGCCTFGNHNIICTCDGTGCCHPEAYKEYNPTWGHAPLKTQPEEGKR